MCLSNVQLEKVGLVHAEKLPSGPFPFIRVVESAGAQRRQAGCDLSFETKGRLTLATEMRAYIPAPGGSKTI